MNVNLYLGIAVLILVLGAELLSFWLLPRLGVEGAGAQLLGAALGGALAGGLLVHWLGARRRSG